MQVAAVLDTTVLTLNFLANGSERMRLTSDGALTGWWRYSFNGDTLAANALDDYEEGTWTPVYVGTSGSIGSTALHKKWNIHKNWKCSNCWPSITAFI
jgi:hypothetical protein